MLLVPPTAESERKGCWSCRARRKRCDGRVPGCNTCERLGIQCAGFAAERPLWMDGGVEQDGYCRRLKDVVKLMRRQSKRRKLSLSSLPESNAGPGFDRGARDFSNMYSPTTSPPLSSFIKTSANHAWLNSQPIPDLEWPFEHDWVTNMGLWSPDLELDDNNQPALNATIIRESQPAKQCPTSFQYSGASSSESSQCIADCSADWLSIMRYLDSSMERLFPFYCSPNREQDKAYLLSLAHRSSLVRHTLISVGSFEDKTASRNMIEGNTEIATKWFYHYCLASEEVETSLAHLLDGSSIRNESRGMTGIESLIGLVHLILLDASTDTEMNVMRFKQGIRLIELLHSKNQGEASQAFGPEPRIQGFFTSLFIRCLVLWRTAHPQEVQCPSFTDILQSIPDNLCGYSTTLLEAVSMVSDLAVWKEEKAAAEILSTLELARRAHGIENMLSSFIELMPEHSYRDHDYLQEIQIYPQGAAHCSQFSIDQTGSKGTASTDRYLQRLTNMILACATQIFLYSVISNPNPRLPEIKPVVHSGIRLLRHAKTAILTGKIAVAWPLSMISKMADRNDAVDWEWLADLAEKIGQCSLAF